MAGATAAWEQGILGLTVAGANISDATYLGFLTSLGDDSGGGTVTEVSGGGYARIDITSYMGSASGSGPAQITNNAEITFAAPSSNWGTILGVGLWTALTGGTLIASDYLGNFVWQPCTITAASPAIITVPDHGFSVDDSLIYLLKYGGLLPTFSQSNLTGSLAVAHVDSDDTFDVTNGGTAVNTSTSGSGMIRKIAPLTLNSGNPALQFPINTLVITQA